MATISLTKVAPLKKAEPATIKINNCDVVFSKLTTEEQAKLIETVLAYSFDDTGMYSPFRFEKTFNLQYIKAASNINFTDKQLEDVGKVCDLLEINGVADAVKELDDYKVTLDYARKCADNIQTYNGSFVNMIKMANQDFNMTQASVNELSEKLSDPSKYKLVKDVLDKIG